MRRERLSAILAICFVVGFALTGIVGETTVAEQTVQARFSVPQVLLSLSSGATLLLPIVLLLAVMAAVLFLTKERNVGALFMMVATILFAAFLIWYASESRNQSLYARLAEELKALGVSFKRRDVSIHVLPEVGCYATLALGVAATAVAFPPSLNGVVRYKLKRELEPYAYIAPHLFFFVVFCLVPSIYGIYAAFTKWNLYEDPVFIGLRNLQTILFDSQNTYYHSFRNGLLNTLKFVLYSVPLCIAVPMALALGMRAVTRGNKFFQAIYYLPSLMSASTVMLAWEYTFKPTYGMMNNFFLSSADWYTPPYSWIMVVLITVWWCNGTNMVIYQSALASVPRDYYEAASIDGANSIQSFVHITLPSLRYPITYTLVTTVIAQFNIYAQPDMLLSYNNSGANAVLMMYIKDTAFGQSAAGIASAMALVLGVIIMIISSMQIRLMQGKGAT